MDWARPNVFQQLVLQWEQLHPYNGGQVARVRRPMPPTDTLAGAWRETLTALGLGPIRWSADPPRRYRFDPLAADPPIVQAHGASDLESLLTAELNRAYGDGEPPLRLIVLPDGADAMYIGIAYRHWVADSVAIRMVLRGLLGRVWPDLGIPAPTGPCDLPAGGYWRLFGPRRCGSAGRWSLPGNVVLTTSQIARLRRVRRLEAGQTRPDVRFSVHRLPDTAVNGMLRFARRCGVRLNDVLLAALALAVHRHGPCLPTPHRPDLAMGSIVDLRPLSRADLSRSFGMYLGFTMSFLRPSQLLSLESAARALGEQSAEHRRRNSAASSQVRMAAGLLVHRCVGTPRQAEWYRKRLPLSAGISNVNLRGEWLQSLHPHVVEEYIRVSPTGPMMPLVISATTLGDRFHFGLTRRHGAVPQDMAQAIADDLTRSLLDVA